MENSTALHTFPRGVHPWEGKEFSEACPIQVLPEPEELKIPMAQHIGAACQPCVKMRDVVEAGQVVGSAEAFVSAPVFASLGGTVKRLGMSTLPNGRHVSAVTVAVDLEKADSAGLFALFCREPEYDLSTFEPGELFNRIRAAGLVGQGGAAFPTHVKLAKNEKKPIDTLLVNGCECEPYLTADYRTLLEMGGNVLAGARFAARAVGAKNVVLCIEDNKPEAVQRMRVRVKALGNASVSVAVMKTKYPQGGEKQLIYAALGRKVPMGGLPMDVGAAVVNVGTCVSIAMAVLYGKPLTHRVVTVTGGGIAKPANLFVPIGTPMKKLVAFCGGLNDGARRVIGGGPMMGFALGSLDIPVTKGTSGITVLTDEELQRPIETNCVRCGRCVAVCPMNLIPTRLAMSPRSKNWELFEKYHPLACVECGSCAFECPAGVPIVQLIRIGKVELQRQKQAKK
ncbi:MAG: electron transport complex subunit RsxC [Planctomycetia bacterium]|nr:electron transport complex subunit RsxC [Planctomycetia bacterium]